jgi:peptidoglycan/xylan/chitin deacetylase (PgdA/CDA1 family)
MYHSISDEDESGLHPYYRVVTDSRRFAEQMQWLAEDGWSAVSLEEGLLRLADDPSNGCRAVAITFDDGFRDFNLEAWPVLQRHGFTATMYLPTAFISRQRISFCGRECLTWDEVRELRAGGIRFGSHTATHPKLHELPWNSIEHEVASSKARLEQELREEIGSFAYPYAFPQEDKNYRATFANLLHRCGYRTCVTTVVGRTRAGDNPLCLRRLPVNSCDDRALFRAKLEGGYDWFGAVQGSLRRAKAWVKRTRRNRD